jgi:hypothetical protein
VTASGLISLWARIEAVGFDQFIKKKYIKIKNLLLAEYCEHPVHSASDPSERLSHTFLRIFSSERPPRICHTSTVYCKYPKLADFYITEKEDTHMSSPAAG